MILEACYKEYFRRNQYKEILSSVQQDITSSIQHIEKEMVIIFHDFLNKEPYYYWNKEVFDQTTSNLEALFKKNELEITEEIIEHFLTGYHTFRQMTEVMNDIRLVNNPPEIHTRLYRIPTYNSIVEGCLSNLYRVITLLLDQTTDKNLKLQNTLSKLHEVLDKHDFNLLTRNVNVDIRNAINHGGVVYKIEGASPVMEFQYTKRREYQVVQMPLYEFDSLIDKVCDVASGLLLGIVTFFNNHKNIYKINLEEKLFAPFSLLALELSLPEARCRSISGLSDNRQLNINMNVKNIDRCKIFQMSMLISTIVYSRYGDFEKYMTSFSGERLATSWVRFTNNEISDLLTSTVSFDTVIKQVIARKDCLVHTPSQEDINIKEVKYFRFPNYLGQSYLINKVEDASLEDRKRLRAHLYIGDIDSREEIIRIITESINWVKKLKNVASPILQIKHGEMEADSVYLNVYRKDTRDNKSLVRSNENFVCKVDYDFDGKSSLNYGGIGKRLWMELYKERVGSLTIAWRNSMYRQIFNQKIARNAPCPCGSGQKYKKCCLLK